MGQRLGMKTSYFETFVSDGFARVEFMKFGMCVLFGNLLTNVPQLSTFIILTNFMRFCLDNVCCDCITAIIQNALTWLFTIQEHTFDHFYSHGSKVQVTEWLLYEWYAWIRIWGYQLPRVAARSSSIFIHSGLLLRDILNNLWVTVHQGGWHLLGE